jgi:hypothetical protein
MFKSKMIIEESGRYKRTKSPIPVPYRSAFDYHLDGTIPMKDAGSVNVRELGNRVNTPSSWLKAVQ